MHHEVIGIYQAGAFAARRSCSGMVPMTLRRHDDRTIAS